MKLGAFGYAQRLGTTDQRPHTTGVFLRCGGEQHFHPGKSPRSEFQWDRPGTDSPHTDVLSGEVEYAHGPDWKDESDLAQEGLCLPCICLPKSELVIDR